MTLSISVVAHMGNSYNIVKSCTILKDVSILKDLSKMCQILKGGQLFDPVFQSFLWVIECFSAELFIPLNALVKVFSRNFFLRKVRVYQNLEKTLLKNRKTYVYISIYSYTSIRGFFSVSFSRGKYDHQKSNSRPRIFCHDFGIIWNFPFSQQVWINDITSVFPKT